MSIEPLRPPGPSKRNQEAHAFPGAKHRIAHLVDPGSFVEFGSQAQHRATAFGLDKKRPRGDGVVTGIANIDERPVALFSQDPGVLGGSLGEIHAQKIVRVMEHAERGLMPIIGLIDSGGARIQEGVAALDGYGTIFRANVRLSGRVPQISVVLGPCAGGAVYSPALTDIVIMAKDRAHMFVTGPKVVRAVTNENVTAAELGGPVVHSQQSGVAHLVASDAEDALRLARQVLSYLPSSASESAPFSAPAPAGTLADIPHNFRKPYDVRGAIGGIVDLDSFLELQPKYARNLVIGFARMEGQPVGIIANQPQALAGTLNSAASEKGARFVRMCDAFGLPLITLVDTPGFLPGTKEESGGVIRRGAKLLYAFAEARVPRITVILRKAFGGAYIVMNSKSLGADAVFAWPHSHIAVMGAEGAIDVIHRRELTADPSRRHELLADYQSTVMDPLVAASRLSIDEIIEPSHTRAIVAATLFSLTRTRRPSFRHDNLPQ
ncbi:MAG: acyl-CoA carboxylase subunit beta [Corynebacteriales bacterium]|nr:acyl-CoA carboxylase subunit beta [Mycobacteriales bacterium]